jgi:TrpR-related protein YerC/YecD
MGAILKAEKGENTLQVIYRSISNMKKRSSPKQLDELYEALTKVETKEEAKLFLDDLLSKNELKALSGRIHSAKMFLEGKTYMEVIEETEISSATLARVSKCVKNGKGYSRILKKL